MTELVFSYGTLMSGFKRRGREGIDPKLQPMGGGWIRAALFDPSIRQPFRRQRSLGAVHRMTDQDAVLRGDHIEGYRAAHPTRSVRIETEAFDDGRRQRVGHFCNPTRPAQIESGDYLHLSVR